MRFSSGSYALWRGVGIVVLAIGLVTLALGLYIGYSLFVQVANAGSRGEGIMNLAIFFSLLSGLGGVAASAGVNLVLIDRPVSSVRLVPWQVLMVSGSLILVSMSSFLAYAVWLEQPLAGASAKGVSILVGIALAFITSGIYQKRRLPKRRSC
ncbi:hypothetical protein [Vreelandella sp. EE22]